MYSLSHQNATWKFVGGKLKYFDLCKNKVERQMLLLNVTLIFVFSWTKQSHPISHEHWQSHLLH